MNDDGAQERSSPSEARPHRALDIEKTVRLLQPEGLVSRFIPGFESRPQQQNMLRAILDVYNKPGIALIEAGTGTGKSMAYLAPAMLWAMQHKERTLISTNTISLQEQLLHKDIPLLAKALNLNIKAVLVKGMYNYLCMRKLEDVRHELRLLPPEEADEFEKIAAWSQHTTDGSRSDLPFVPSHATWERLGAEHDACSYIQCPHYEQCHFFKARREAAEAQILIVNHHLLCHDLAARQEEAKNAILPHYGRVILDEAHHIEDVATEHFASRISYLDILSILKRLMSDNKGKLPALKKRMEDYFKKNPPKALLALQTRLSIDLPGLRHEILHQASRTFQAYSEFMEILKKPAESDENLAGDQKLRLLQSHHAHPDWAQKIVTLTQQLVVVLNRYAAALNGLIGELKMIADERFEEQTKSICLDINALGLRLVAIGDTLKQFISNVPTLTAVRWIETQSLRTMLNVELVEAELNIAPMLVTLLFSKFPTIVLCSATLTTNRKFDFFRQRLGLTSQLCQHQRIEEHIYESPFNYSQQALFAIPTDIPDPQTPEFTLSATEHIWTAIQASRGNAFVLFTSYAMLKNCHQLLAARLEQNRYISLKQGDDNRRALLKRFTSTDRSVLFGTDSFWEGVDVVGEALRCVIIVKLPFKVPSEPIIQARAEAILAQGGNPFMDYALPSAIVKFKQGVGRLIRNQRDRGCIVCLDSRLLNRPYGQQFLNSLPPYQQLFIPSGSLSEQMSAFYRRTYHMTVPKTLIAP